MYQTSSTEWCSCLTGQAGRKNHRPASEAHEDRCSSDNKFREAAEERHRNAPMAQIDTSARGNGPPPR
jgi:hypothetical protein